MDLTDVKPDYKFHDLIIFKKYSIYMLMQSTRILRIPLPIKLIYEMDELVTSGKGGLDSREDLAREAIEAMVLELRYGLAEPEAQLHQDTTDATPLSLDPPDVSFTALQAPLDTSCFVKPLASSLQPASGFHNRDYPSLWAAAQLGKLLKEESMAFADMAEVLVEQAWIFAEQLVRLDDVLIGKPSALFPTNQRKRQSAEGNFLMFAVGALTHGNSGEHIAQGTLFDWQVLGMEMTPSGPQVGFTHVGQELLNSMAGLTVIHPHPADYTHRFLDYLSKYAPGDWLGFQLMLRSVNLRIRREELIDVFHERWPMWKRKVASNNAAGYIARGREWGLVEMGQVDRCYALTELGHQVLSGQGADL